MPGDSGKPLAAKLGLKPPAWRSGAEQDAGRVIPSRADERAADPAAPRHP